VANSRSFYCPFVRPLTLDLSSASLFLPHISTLLSACLQSIGIAAAPKFASPSSGSSARKTTPAVGISKSRAAPSPASLSAPAPLSSAAKREQSRVGAVATSTPAPAAAWQDEDLEGLEDLLDDEWT